MTDENAWDDLAGVHGAEHYRDLPEGTRLLLTDGAKAEIVANAGDGAWLIVRIVEDEADPSRVGEEVPAYFNDDVKRVIGAEEAQG
jgi:hypothetical protein